MTNALITTIAISAGALFFCVVAMAITFIALSNTDWE